MQVQVRVLQADWVHWVHLVQEEVLPWEALEVFLALGLGLVQAGLDPCSRRVRDSKQHLIP